MPRTLRSRGFLRMTKLEALKAFRAWDLRLIRTQHERDGRINGPMRREAWNNYTDDLCKSGDITLHQYISWANPY